MNEIQAFIKLLAAAGFKAESYSGRNMYGKKCIGVRTDGNEAVVVFKIGKAFVHADREITRELGTLADDIAHTKSETLGYGLIVYWPHLQWEEPEEDSDESPED